MPDIVRVLVVDDSAYVRKVVSEMLGRSPFIEVVGVARDGADALERAAALKPDVITCDLNMPVMDGVGFVRAQMAREPVPIVIISIAAGVGEQVLAALDAGAVDFVQKPTALATERLMEMADELVGKVTAAARAPRKTIANIATGARNAPRRQGQLRHRRHRHFDRRSAGAQTAHPESARRLPCADRDGHAHAPWLYGDVCAPKLDEMSALHVVEADAGMLVEAGTVLLAPAGRHLTFRRTGGEVRTHLDVLPLDTPHRPSVDALFHSAADVYDARVLGVVMTGMGSDGREGAGWIKVRGGCILTEAEDTCVVYGMPRAVVEAGLSDGAEPLDRMAQAIMERI